MINLLLGFDGRISRTQFWIGMLITAAVELILMFIFDMPFFPAEMKQVSVRLIEFAIQLVTHLSDGGDRGETAARPQSAGLLCRSGSLA